ncbi:hypothetical protein L0152_02120 [bacterium]|nr:hypothetical protein [bacterium]
MISDENSKKSTAHTSFIEDSQNQNSDKASKIEKPQFDPGQMIAHYKIICKIGSGGMGEVYLAEDVRLGRRVALKILSEQFVKDNYRLHRFRQEARAAISTKSSKHYYDS